MRFTATKPAKRVALVAALGVGLLTATGCGYINAQQTTHQYAASDGIRADIGSLQLRNMLIVSDGKSGSGSALSAEAPGRLAGTIFNTSAQDVALTIQDASSTIRLDVPKNGQITLGQDGKNVDLTEAGAIPGGLSKVKVTVNGTAQELQIPVLDSTLPEYRSLMPTPSGTPTSTGSATGTATPTPTPTASH